MTLLKASQVEINGGTQTRAFAVPLAIQSYAEAIRDGAQFPPVTVFYDGTKYWLADGFHRYAAYREAGISEIEVDVHQGTRRDAILYSVGANAKHGIPRTGEDKRRAVETLLRDEEWSRWSNAEIARRCAVSAAFVGKLRPEASLNRLEIQAPRKAIRNGKEYTVTTGNIGKREPKPAEPAKPAPPSEPEPKPHVAPKPSEAKPAVTPKPPETRLVTTTAKEPEKPARQTLPYAAVADAVTSWSDDDQKSLMRHIQTLLASKGVKSSLSFG